MVYNFLFHRVHPERNSLWDPMDVSLFEKSIKYIYKNFDVRLAEELYLSPVVLNGEKRIATIMFDDGYLDNLDYAVPILKKYNCKASFYVVTNCIDNNIPVWTYSLEYYFSKTNVTEFGFNFDFLPSRLNVSKLISPEERHSYVSELKPLLKTVPNEDRERLISFVKEKCIDVNLPEMMMNWNDLRYLKNEGHYIGSHTMSHPSLATISDLTILKEELKKSGEMIKENLGYFPVSISYPVGSFNEDTKRISIECGYKFGLAVKQDIHNPSLEDNFEISRIELYNESWFKTMLRINNTLEKIKKLIRYR